MVQLINTNTPGIGAIVSLGKIINIKHKYVNIDINGHVWLVIVIMHLYMERERERERERALTFVCSLPIADSETDFFFRQLP